MINLWKMLLSPRFLSQEEEKDQEAEAGATKAVTQEMERKTQIKGGD